MKRKVLVDRIATDFDANVCVLCGQPNDCALAKAANSESEQNCGAGQSGQSREVADGRPEGGSCKEVNGPCWCVGKTFPPALLAKATALDQGAGCICRGCLSRAAESDTEENEEAID